MSRKSEEFFAEAEFKRLARVKRPAARASGALGPELVTFFKQSVERRQNKFARIANSWSQLVPPTLAEHCALESYSRGSLTVLVDSASHLYELKQLLLAGLQQQLLLACNAAGLKKIALRPGRWYDEGRAGGAPAARRLRFD